MSYQIEFLKSKRIEDQWGYNLYFNFGASSYQPYGMIYQQPISHYLVCNRQDFFFTTSTPFNAFIEMSEDGLKVDYELSEIDLPVSTQSDIVTLEDTVEITGPYYAIIQTASYRLTSLLHSVQLGEVPVSWVIQPSYKISAAPGAVKLNCLESFVKQLDLTPIQPVARGTYTIAGLIAMGAIAEYCTFSEITISPRVM